MKQGGAEGEQAKTVLVIEDSAVQRSILRSSLSETDPESLIKLANVALYQAKHGGRNRVVCAE